MHRILLTLILAVVACDQTAADDTQTAPAPRRVPVETVVAGVVDLRETLVSSSTVDSRNAVDIVAEIPGTIVELSVEQGETVKARQQLARISRAELDLGVQSASSAVAQLEREVERLRPLYEQGILPRQQYDDVRYRLEQARGEQRRANLSASDRRITSPTAGVIAIRYVNLGQQVATGTPVFRVVQPDDLVVHVNLPESNLGRVFEGQTAYIHSEALGDVEFPSTVERVSPVVDPRTGTAQVTLDVQLADAPAKLRPGMFVKTFIVTQERSAVVAVPRRAVVRTDEGAYAFVVEAGTARRRALEVGVAEGGLIEVVNGITAGEAVVVLGQDGLKDGTAVDAQLRTDGT